MRTLIQWLISALAIVLTAYMLPGAQVTFVGALLAAVVLGVLNMFIKPLLVLLTLPINILTLGLFTFIINGLLIYLASAIVPGFHVSGFGTAVLFGIVLMIVHLLFFWVKV